MRTGGRTKTFNAIVDALQDGQWHSLDEVAEKTRYADEWIDALQRESILETDEQDGQLLVRLRADVPDLDSALALT